MIISYGNLYQEELREGSLFAVSYAKGEPLNAQLQTYPYAFSIVADGVDLRSTWTQTGLTQKALSDGGTHTVLTLRSEMGGLQVGVHTELDPPASDGEAHSLQRYLEITNLRQNPVSLTQVQVLGGGLFAQTPPQNGAAAYRIGSMRDGAPGEEGDFRWQALSGGEYCYELCRYHERYHTPFAIVQDIVLGNSVVLQLGFSGGFRFSFSNFLLSCPACTNLSFCLEAGTIAPIRVLEAGETVSTPIAHLTYVHGGLDEAIQMSHTHIRRFGNQWGKHCAVECATMTKEESDVRRALEIAEQLRAEIFYIDAGWYIPKAGDINRWPAYTGDWEREVDAYDTSLDEFREICHSKGMKFGLWMDPEKLGFDTEIVASGKLRYLTDYSGNAVVDGPCSYMTDLTDSGTAEWLYRSICHVIDRYQLDYFRLDSGAFPAEAQHTVCGLRENADWRYYDMLYGILKRLRAKYPDVVFQNCAGGGGRVDLGLTPILSNTWISDQNRAPHSMRIINGTSMLLPTEYCVKLINGMGAQWFGSDYFKLNAARFGSPLIPIEMDDPVFCQRSERMLNMYRQYIRPMLDTCLVWHHTPEVTLDIPGSRGILEISSPDGDCAMIAAFTLAEVIHPDILLSMKGVHADKQYKVWSNDEPLGNFSGEQLRQGMSVQITQAYDSVCLIAKELD